MGESQEVTCACPGAAICSAVYVAGGSHGRALLEWFPRWDAASFFFYYFHFFK